MCRESGKENLLIKISFQIFLLINMVDIILFSHVFFTIFLDL